MAEDWDVTPTCGAQLVHAERVLAAAGSPIPWQDAVELLSHALGMPMPVLLARPSLRLRPTDVRRYASLVTQRASGETLAHITGHVTFMGLEIAMGPTSPPIPADARRRTEIALDWARHHAAGELSAAEIGTGCGAIALALAALEPRFTRIYAVDSSATALETAIANGARYLLNLVISWVEGHGLEVVPEPVDLVVCSSPGQLAPAGDPSEAGAAVEVHVAPEEGETSARRGRLLTRAAAKLRPGGALIIALDCVRQPETLSLIGRALPDAQIWVDAQANGDAIAVAQVPAS